MPSTRASSPTPVRADRQRPIRRSSQRSEHRPYRRASSGLPARRNWIASTCCVRPPSGAWRHRAAYLRSTSQRRLDGWCFGARAPECIQKRDWNMLGHRARRGIADSMPFAVPFKASSSRSRRRHPCQSQQGVLRPASRHQIEQGMAVRRFDPPVAITGRHRRYHRLRSPGSTPARHSALRNAVTITEVLPPALEECSANGRLRAAHSFGDLAQPVGPSP